MMSAILQVLGWTIAIVAPMLSLLFARTHRRRRLHATVSLAVCFLLTSGLLVWFAGIHLLSFSFWADRIARDAGVLSALIFLGVSYKANDKWSIGEAALLSLAWIAAVLPSSFQESTLLWIGASLAAAAMLFAPAPMDAMIPEE